MPTPAAVWPVIGIAAVAALLPSVYERLFVAGPRRDPKALGWRLLELVAFGGRTIAARLGPGQARRREFNAAVGGGFLILLGFVWRQPRRRA